MKECSFLNTNTIINTIIILNLRDLEFPTYKTKFKSRVTDCDVIKPSKVKL